MAKTFERNGVVMSDLAEEGKGVSQRPNRAETERIAEIDAEMKAYAVKDLMTAPSELDKHPELTETDDRPWNIDDEMDRLWKLDAQAAMEHADEMPFSFDAPEMDNR